MPISTCSRNVFVFHNHLQVLNTEIQKYELDIHDFVSLNCLFSLAGSLQKWLGHFLFICSHREIIRIKYFSESATSVTVPNTSKFCNLHIVKNLNSLILTSLQPDGINLWYFKPWQGLKNIEFVAKIHFPIVLVKKAASLKFLPAKEDFLYLQFCSFLVYKVLYNFVNGVWIRLKYYWDMSIQRQDELSCHIGYRVRMYLVVISDTETGCT